MHPACWRLFCEQHALLATQTPTNPNLDALGAVFASQVVEEEGRGLQPDWTIDYVGAETFWGDGWAWTEDTRTSEIGQLLDVNEEYDFLVLDPERIELPNAILRHPPLLPIGEQMTLVAFPYECFSKYRCFFGDRVLESMTCTRSWQC